MSKSYVAEAVRRPYKDDVKRSFSPDYIATSDYANALMSKEWGKAISIRNKWVGYYIRKRGSEAKLNKPTPFP